MQISFPMKSEAADKAIKSNKWYVVDMTGTGEDGADFIASGPYSTEKEALKAKRPDVRGAVLDEVMTGQDCKDEGITWG